MKITVTGSTGFIGSHVAEGLKADGHDITLLVRDPARIPFNASGYRVLRGDMLDAGSIKAALAGADAVVHCAAKVGEWGSREDFNRTNIEGMKNLIAACVATGARRVVHISSMSVYGNGERDLLGVTEDEPMCKTGILYGESKIDSEKMLFEAHARGEVVASALRPGMVWGPRDGAFLPKIIEGLKKGMFVYPAGGNKIVGLAHVDNVVEIVRLCLAKEISHGRAYNVTDGDKRTMRDLVKALCKRVGCKEPLFSVPAPLAKGLAVASESFFRAIGSKKAPFLTKMGIYILCYHNDGSIDRARKELGYDPKDRFEEQMDEYFRIVK